MIGIALSVARQLDSAVTDQHVRKRVGRQRSGSQ